MKKEIVKDLLGASPSLMAALCLTYIVIRLTDWTLDVDVAFGVLSGLVVPILYNMSKPI